ncbi:MAG TPA: SCO family protein [Sphingomicrobium sp.]|nr:SCO family protein [Sphingomicrobium sp.]
MPPTKALRLILWALVALAAAGAAVLALRQSRQEAPPPSANSNFGGAFTLTGADGKPFSSQSLEGKPYAIYFGFTRCGDVCPTTLSRLVKLRREAGPERALRIVFVTIDPAHDGPEEVGQYAKLFGSPIIGLTGSAAQIDQVKKQYGIFAQPMAHPVAGKEMEHTATVLLIDRGGKFIGTITPGEQDESALASMKALIG